MDNKSKKIGFIGLGAMGKKVVYTGPLLMSSTTLFHPAAAPKEILNKETSVGYGDERNTVH